MKHISEAIGQFLKKSSLGLRQEENFIFDNWEKIVGPEIAKQAEPFKMDGKKLFIWAENSVIMNEITYKKKAIKDKINSLFKAQKVKEIVLRLKQ
jgi:predicted nucleic acid-binding Zn ribbon protein